MHDFESLQKGLVDSLSIHRTIPAYVNNSNIFMFSYRVFLSNVFLLLGSVLLFDTVISPAFNQFLALVTADASKYVKISTSLNAIYHLLWVIPIYLLCYACSISWYQELSTHIFHHLKPNLKKNIESSSNSIYAFIVWFVTYLKLQLIGGMLPSIISTLFPNSLFFKICRISCIAFGILLQSILYAYYSFDALWIACGDEPDSRFNRIEETWIYYFAFGLPYVLVVRQLNFFIGYGCFLSVFPIMLLLAAIADSKTRNIPSTNKSEISKFYKVFKISRIVASIGLKQFQVKFVKKKFISLKKDRNNDP